MRDIEFEHWLKVKYPKPGTWKTYRTETRRIAKNVGDLDRKYEEDGFASLFKSFECSKDAGGLPSDKIPHNADPFVTANFRRRCLELYSEFYEQNKGVNTQDKVLLKEVGKSQHKDGVRIDKAFHDIFNPPNSVFYTKRGTRRPITVTFNGKDFDAEYRFEGTKAKEVDLQRIGFFTGLREEFKQVFPVPRGTFTIRVGGDLNHFIFNHEQVTSDTYNQQLEDDIAKSRRDSKEARSKRLAEAARKPASVQVASVAYVRNPDVIVEVLERAEGKCESCLQDAPFLRAKDNTPYLEVHHKVPLSEGGEDVVENALAVCPNCHRKMHYG